MDKDQLNELKEEIEGIMEDNNLGIDDRYWLTKMLYKDAEADIDDYFWIEDEEFEGLEEEDEEQERGEDDGVRGEESERVSREGVAAGDKPSSRAIATEKPGVQRDSKKSG